MCKNKFDENALYCRTEKDKIKLQPKDVTSFTNAPLTEEVP